MNTAALLAFLAVTPLHAPSAGSPAGPPHRPEHHPERPAAVCDPAVMAAFDDLDDALRHLDDQLAGLKGKRQRREHLRGDLADAVEAAREARRASCRASRPGPRVVVVEPPPPPRPAVLVLDDEGHRGLVQAVRREAFDEARLGLLDLGVRGVCVTSIQARDLVRQMSFSQSRLDAVRLLAPRIVDRAESYQLLEVMTFDTDKRAAREILASTSTAGECVVLPLDVRRG